MKSFPSYVRVVDCAKILEIEEIEVHAFQERTKRLKTKGGFSGHSSKVINKRI